MAMNIHVLSEIPSILMGNEASVLEDLLERQYGKFILSKEKVPRLVLFPFYCKDIDIVRLKLNDLEIAEFQGAGKLRISRIGIPLYPNDIEMDFGSDTFLEAFGADRPHNDTVVNELLAESVRLIADVLTSVQQRRMDNDAWKARRTIRTASI